MENFDELELQIKDCNEKYPLFKADTLIESTWLAVVDFIKYYNKEVKK